MEALLFVVVAVIVFVVAFFVLSRRKHEANNSPQTKIGVVVKRTPKRYQTYGELKAELTKPIVVEPKKEVVIERKKLKDMEFTHNVFNQKNKLGSKDAKNEHSNDTEFKRDKHYDLEPNNGNHDVSTLLQNPNSLRNSFIINEIFSKKYFD